MAIQCACLCASESALDVSANGVRTCFLEPKIDGDAHAPSSNVTSARKIRIHTLERSC